MVNNNNDFSGETKPMKNLVFASLHYIRKQTCISCWNIPKSFIRVIFTYFVQDDEEIIDLAV